MGQCEAHTTRLTAFIHGTDRRANSVRALLSTDAFSAVLLASCGSVTTSNDSDNVLMVWFPSQVSAAFHRRDVLRWDVSV